MEKRKDIIACKIFETELSAILSTDDNLRIHWIDAALHADPAKMKVEISKRLSEMEPSKSEICFLFGNGCHPDMCTIAGECGVLLPREKNCIHALLGPSRTKELEQNRTMIISPGWLEAWPSIMSGLGWDQVDVRMNMGRYDKILLLDPGILPLDDNALITFYDLVQVPVEIMEISLDYFKEFVDGILEKTEE